MPPPFQFWATHLESLGGVVPESGDTATPIAERFLTSRSPGGLASERELFNNDDEQFSRGQVLADGLRGTGVLGLL